METMWSVPEYPNIKFPPEEDLSKVANYLFALHITVTGNWFAVYRTYTGYYVAVEQWSPLGYLIPEQHKKCSYKDGYYWAAFDRVKDLLLALDIERVVLVRGMKEVRCNI